MDQSVRPIRQRQDRLLTAITGTVAILVFTLSLGAIRQQSGPLALEIPFFVPAIAGIASLAAFGVAVLVLGRYRVVHDPPAFWVGLCFSALGVLYLFFLLTWPGAQANGQGIIARLPDTSAWIILLENLVIAVLLLVAVLARWPGPGTKVSRHWLAWVLALTSLWVAISLLIVAFESELAPLNIHGAYGGRLLLAVAFLLQGAGAVIAGRRYLNSGERLTGYLSLAEIWALGSLVARLLTGSRFELWWYVFHLFAIAPIVVMLYGVLADYVGLYRRERERSAELQRQQALLEAVLAQMPAGVLIAEAPSGRLLMGAPPGGQPLAVSSWDTSEPGARRGYHADGRPYRLDEWPLERALRHGETVHDQEVYVDRADGVRGILSVSAAPVRDSRGEVVAAVEIHQDMTERRRDEQALRESEARLRDVLQNSRDAIYRLSLITRTYEYFSPAIEGLTGYTAQEIVDMGPDEFAKRVHLDDQAAYQAHSQALLESAEAEPTDIMEYRWLVRSGVYRWFSVHRQLVRDAQGRPVAHVGTIRDITERQEAEMEQHRLARQRQLALDAARMGWWHYDPQAGIVRYDERYREIFGLPQGEGPLEDTLARVHPQGMPNVRAAIESVVDFADPQPRGGEFRIIRDDGAVRWVAVQGLAVIQDDGTARRATGVVGTVADVTERKGAEEALRAANEELRRFNRAMVGRELRMIELKREINALCERLGQPPRYSLDPDKESL